MKFLFWNIQKKPLVKEVAELIIESGSNICAFAEMSDETHEEIIIVLKNKYGVEGFLRHTPGCNRIKIIIIGKNNEIELLNQHQYYSLVKTCNRENNLIIAFVHFPSKLYCSLNDLRAISEKLSKQVTLEEDNNSIVDSLLIGDFNVDPFEMPLISFSGLSATNGLVCSKREQVTRLGEKSKLFYNPMWTLYSNYKDRPGSHKYSRLGEDVVSWHFLDQVLIRPALIDSFKFESLKLLEGTENYNYLNKSRAPSLSDHLPLTCELEY